MRVYQVLATVLPGSAVSHEAFAMDSFLKRAGYRTSIHAMKRGNGLPSGLVLPLNEMPQPQANDIILYHMCQETPLNENIKGYRCRKLAVYHNVTPPRFFDTIHSYQAAAQRRALFEIQMLSNTFDLCIAHSNFSKEDLIRRGYDADRIVVVPLLLDFDRYSQAPSSEGLGRYRDGWTNFLFVGRIAPNKKPEDVLRIYAWYRKWIDERSRLILAGPPFSAAYTAQLKAYAAASGSDDVVFTGQIAFDEIIACYLAADVFVCMSEHEGFCVPLLEAMLFNVPIVAYNSTAVVDTLGGSGALVDDKDPVFISLLCERLIRDVKLRGEVVKGQRDRLEAFQADRTEAKLKEALGRLIERPLRNPPSPGQTAG